MEFQVGDRVQIHSPDGAVGNHLSNSLYWEDLPSGVLVSSDGYGKWVVDFGVRRPGLHRCVGALKEGTGQFVLERFLVIKTAGLEWD